MLTPILDCEKSTEETRVSDHTWDLAVLESDDSGAGSEEEGGPGRRRRVQVKENLNSQLTSYTITGLEPGEKYVLELGTKTGNVPTKR